MIYQVVFAPVALAQLEALYRHIAQVASPDIAQRYTSAIVSYCETLQKFPQRGTRRDDIRPGLRITNYKGRAVIAFEVGVELVSIVGVFYGGQDFESDLGAFDPDLMG
ncbi:MAG: type II toxin-antitoxin system RelE/ParE family toxin [Rhodoferax sp.]|jgi:plasmid stabilization system protein ParE|nr:type II toxin-antitoxin system RelE/ParE family toxin [Rhodoferax sp.]